jgi:hypothetical protein
MERQRGRSDLVSVEMRSRASAALWSRTLLARCGREVRLAQRDLAGKVKAAAGGQIFGGQVRDTPQPFVLIVQAAFLDTLRNSNSGGDVYARRLFSTCAQGLSMRDIEDAFTDETGRDT